MPPTQSHQNNQRATATTRKSTRPQAQQGASPAWIKKLTFQKTEYGVVEVPHQFPREVHIQATQWFLDALPKGEQKLSKKRRNAHETERNEIHEEIEKEVLWAAREKSAVGVPKDEEKGKEKEKGVKGLGKKGKEGEGHANKPDKEVNSAVVDTHWFHWLSPRTPYYVVYLYNDKHKWTPVGVIAIPDSCTKDDLKKLKRSLVWKGYRWYKTTNFWRWACFCFFIDYGKQRQKMAAANQNAKSKSTPTSKKTTSKTPTKTSAKTPGKTQARSKK